MPGHAASVRVLEERESGAGWTFVVGVTGEPGEGERRVTVRIAWADYEYWAGGSRAPSRVAGAVVRFLLERDGLEALGDAFDAARVRRTHRDLDNVLPAML